MKLNMIKIIAITSIIRVNAPSDPIGEGYGNIWNKVTETRVRTISKNFEIEFEKQSIFFKNLKETDVQILNPFEFRQKLSF